MTNIGISLTDINVDPNNGVKTKFVLDILSLCETNKEKILVSSQQLPPLTLLEKMLVVKKNWSKGSEILRLDGNTHVELRENIVEQFNQALDSKVLFASIRACGEGNCLTCANQGYHLGYSLESINCQTRNQQGLQNWSEKEGICISPSCCRNFGRRD